jgi:hypothetical protein
MPTINILGRYICEALLWKNQRLVTDEPVEVGDFSIIYDPFRGIYRMYLK